MKNQPKKDGFLHLPEFPGGKKALNAFIKDNLKYPKAALENKIEGKVYLQFEVNNNGKVSKVKVRNGIGYGCDEEAIRIIKLMRYTPAQNKRNKVVLKKNIHIEFKLPPEKVKLSKQQTQQIQYSITPSNSKEKESIKKSSTSYNYTVDL